MPSTTEICQKCNIGKLWATPIKNMYNRTEGYEVECPMRECGYRGFRKNVESIWI